jgi:predicted NodU family carbamoyl transferase
LNSHTLYLGPERKYSIKDIEQLCDGQKTTLKDSNDNEIAELLTKKNIVAVFQGKSENGPRALGNRSLLFDPTFKDGKDFNEEAHYDHYGCNSDACFTINQTGIEFGGVSIFSTRQ